LLRIFLSAPVERLHDQILLVREQPRRQYP